MNASERKVFSVVLEKRLSLWLDDEAAVSASAYGAGLSHALTFQVQMESFGFALSPKLLLALSNLDVVRIGEIYENTVKTLACALGAHRVFEPMYPNFPRQVIEASDMELLVNALMHYTGDWLGVRILPFYEKKKRRQLKDDVRPRLLDIARNDEPGWLLSAMLSANSSLSESEKAQFSVLFDFASEKGKAFAQVFAADIQQKETLTFVAAKVFADEKVDFACVSGKFRTSTDVLRFAVALSGGDISLSANTKFAKFSRPVRKTILSLLESVSNVSSHENVLSDMFSRRETWLRLGERLHPGELAKVFPKSCALFADLRSGNAPQSFMSKVEEAFVRSDAMSVLSERPGIFARNVMRLLYSGVKGNDVAKEFSKVASEVSTPVLLQLRGRLTAPDDAPRVFLPKGEVSKLFVEENSPVRFVPRSADGIVDVVDEALKSRFSKLPPLGRVWIDPENSGLLVPSGGRSASKSFMTVTRGSRMALGADARTIRFFIWWKEDSDRVDLDLSVLLFDEDFKMTNWCSWTQLKSLGMTHSGDITSAPDGACEFIDVKMDDAAKNGARYFAMVVNSYTGQNMCDIPECFAGWMEREKRNSGEIFDMRTVRQKFDLTSRARTVLPMFVDMQTREVVWTDMDVKSITAVANRQSGAISRNLKAFANMHRPDLGALFRLHAEARGQLVSSPEEADMVFSSDKSVWSAAGKQVVSPLERDLILSEFMG